MSMLLQLFALELLLFHASDARESCTAKLDWRLVGRKLLLNGEPFVLKGITMTGLETDGFSIRGTHRFALEDFLDFVASNGFNSIRVPLSSEAVLDNPLPVGLDCNYNPKLCNRSALDGLDELFHQSASRGLLVLLAHTKQRNGRGEIAPTKYDYPTAERALRKMADRYVNRWNFLGIEIHDRPEDGSATWNRQALELIQMLSVNRPINIFVPGHGVAFGTTFEGAPLDEMSRMGRVIFTATFFGPDFGEFHRLPTPKTFEFKRAAAVGSYPLIVSSWGGRNEWDTADEKWHNSLAEWMRNSCGAANNFYYALAPDEQFSNGILLDDWMTPNTRKLALLEYVQPTPTRIERIRKGRVCVEPGQFALPQSCEEIRDNGPAVEITISEDGRLIEKSLFVLEAATGSTEAPTFLSSPPTTAFLAQEIPLTNEQQLALCRQVSVSVLVNDQSPDDYSLEVVNNSPANICGASIALKNYLTTYLTRLDGLQSMSPDNQHFWRLDLKTLPRGRLASNGGVFRGFFRSADRRSRSLPTFRLVSVVARHARRRYIVLC